MTDPQVRDEAMTLFVAGHETTALALTYALYLLAAHPEQQELLADGARSRARRTRRRVRRPGAS